MRESDCAHERHTQPFFAVNSVHNHVLENYYKQFLSKTELNICNLLYSSLHLKLYIFLSLSPDDKDGNEATK